MTDKSTFLKLYLPLQSDLLGYILCTGVSPNSAEDVLQNAAIVLHKKFEQFEAGTNFRAWAYRVVRFEVLKMREWQAKQPMALSEEAMDRLEATALADERPSPRLQALSRCLGRLTDKARSLVRMRYDQRLPVTAIADRLRRPVESIYTTLSRIRKSLQQCVQQAESREAVGS
jgi:RNA polymerase sigma-70 factor (ECF subfamily)